MSPTVTNYAIVLVILLGLVQCFWGYRMFKFLLCIFGFVGGALLFATVGKFMVQDVQTVMVFGLIGGLIGAISALPLYLIGLFLAGTVLGGLSASVILTVYGGSVEAILVLGLALLGGVCALVFQKAMVILSTACSGAWVVVIGLLCILTGQTALEHLYRTLEPTTAGNTLVLGAWLALGAMGVFIQLRGRAGSRAEASKRA